MMTETSVRMELLAGCYDVVANRTLGKLLHDNMVEVGPPKFTEEDYAFGK
jgi:aminobenzoyl-glutamate utilization protein B